MKILVLTSELSVKNGWGRYSLDLIAALKKQGIEVSVATGKRGENETGVSALKCLPQFLDYNSNYFLAPWYAWRLRHLAAECDLIHAFAEPYSYIAYWLSKLTGKKYLITTHGTYGVLPYSLPLKRYFHGKSFRGAQTIICVSEYTKRLLSEFGLNNLAVIHNGINFGKFHASPTPAFEERENSIVTVGALKPRKGQHISIAAFAKVAQHSNGAHYYIVGDQGDADYFSRLKRLTVELNIADKVRFLSSISDEELMKLYRKSKACVLASISKGGHFEGFGLVYLEANASGTPTIGSKDSGAEDAIQDGATGLLVPQGDISALAQAMERFLGDGELWQKTSVSSVVWAKAHDWGEVVKEYARAYNFK